MFFKLYCCYVIYAFLSFTGAVKVNMHGSLSLGKEVMDTITYYLRSGYKPILLSSRRSLNAKLDPIALEVKNALLCANFQFCSGNLETFVNDYVTSLAQTIEGIFEGILNPQGTLGGSPYFGKLKGFLNEVRKILKTVDEKADEDRESYQWVAVIKKISAKFQRKTITYILDKLEADPRHMEDIQKKLTQSIVIDITVVEAKAQKRLCSEFHICKIPNECTTALHAFLGRLTKMPDTKIKSFMKALYESLEDSTFYFKLTSETADEFKVILNNMSYSDDVPTKEILISIQQTVEIKMNTMLSSTDLTYTNDIHLVHMILSDMDYFFSKHKSDRLHTVLDNFLEWMKSGGKLGSHVRDAIKAIEKVLSSTSEDLLIKLITEVRVFLEITVDPEK